MQDINAFEVMKLLARARELEAAGRTIIHMEIGEPDFVSPEPVIQAGQAALASGLTHYTAALGLPALREAISEHYRRHHAVNVSANRIIITPGASGALQLVCGVLLNPGDQVLMADPGYPCNRNFVRLVEAQAISVPVTAETAYQLTPQLIEAYWQPDTVAVMAASPSNPTGTILEHGVMQTIHEIVGEKHGALIVDEIYHGLVYGNKLHTACEIADDIFVINSFSKYFGMTGWRIGWLVVPEAYVEPVDRLAQNIFLAASTPAQYAALAALDPQTESILHARRDEYARRRDYLIPALQQLGFDIPVKPEGAFYIYANCERFTSDSYAFADELLEKAGVAITPGMDFGTNQAAQHVRFAYTTSLENLKEGVRRLQEFL
jgi:aspartate/methionine/tyrosine aminotransferase